MATDKQKSLSLPTLILAGGFSGSVAELFTIPFDTIKVRMQVFQGKYKSQLDCGRQMYKQEGPKAFFQGITAGILRQISFAGIRIGLFDSAMARLAKKKGIENINIVDRILYGIITGGIAISVANPVDMIKVRFQGDIRTDTGVKRYNSVVDAAVKIYKQEGIRSFYQSLPPNILRNSVINAAELASYSQIRQYVLENKLMKDTILCHFVCSAFAGFMAVMVGSPFDVIKSRMMDGKLVDGVKVNYKGVGEAVVSLYRNRGFFGFYAGVSSNFTRIVTWNIIMFMVKEQVHKRLKKTH